MYRRRWLADEMVGRLARYLRILGQDTEYIRGLSDPEIIERVRAEERILVTRDRHLALRVPGSVLLTSPELLDQLRELRSKFPDLPVEPVFDRCTECNGVLEAWDSSATPPVPRLPLARIRQGLAVYQCARCGHLYWEGSHTRSLRERIGSIVAAPRADDR